MKIKNIIFLCCGLFFYIAFLLILIWMVHRSMFPSMKGWKKYEASIWYQPWGEIENSWNSKTHILVGISMIIIMVGTVFVYYVGESGLQKILFIPDNAVLIEYEMSHIGIAGAFAAGVGLAMGLPYFLPGSLMFAVTRGMIQENDRKESWEYSRIFMVLGLIVGLPIMILGTNTYAYLLPEKVVVKNIFSLTEKEYLLEDAKYTDISHGYTKTSKNLFFSYHLYMENGEKVEFSHISEETMKMLNTWGKDIESLRWNLNNIGGQSN